jgi:hypothetical protein
MKKLDALIAGFADEVFRTIRGATLEELAELLGSPMPAEPARRSAARLSRSGAAAQWPPPRPPRLGAGRSGRLHEHAAHADSSAVPDAPVVAEITDPERLLRIESSVSLPPSRPEEAASPPEPSPEPPPVSTEKPVSPPPPPVLLRANEALVRASSAGVVIRRRKEA